jgi:hypothetical protein
MPRQATGRIPSPLRGGVIEAGQLNPKKPTRMWWIGGPLVGVGVGVGRGVGVGVAEGVGVELGVGVACGAGVGVAEGAEGVGVATGVTITGTGPPEAEPVAPVPPGISS